MEWIRENWVFIIFFALFIAMHLFGFGCGGHGGHKGHGEEGEEHKKHSDKDSSGKEQKGDHGCC